ncbi:MAG: class I SAM-dependent methyltransferase, partial [Chloroflexota bacterium]
MYDRLAQFYEWEHLYFQDDLPLYLGFAQAADGAILDAACGTGRVALPLAEAGYQVTGVDSSPEMLSIARSKAANITPGAIVRFVQSDLRKMDLGQQFGMALVALGSFHHLLTVDDQR